MSSDLRRPIAQTQCSPPSYARSQVYAHLPGLKEWIDAVFPAGAVWAMALSVQYTRAVHTHTPRAVYRQLDVRFCSLFSRFFLTWYFEAAERFFKFNTIPWYLGDAGDNAHRSWFYSHTPMCTTDPLKSMNIRLTPAFCILLSRRFGPFFCCQAHITVVNAR